MKKTKNFTVLLEKNMLEKLKKTAEVFDISVSNLAKRIMYKGIFASPPNIMPKLSGEIVKATFSIPLNILESFQGFAKQNDTHPTKLFRRCVASFFKEGGKI